jgi:hypothetical protein
MSAAIVSGPEQILLATLHKVGPGIRLVDDYPLAKVFNDAASEYSDLFGPFSWHPHYHVSELLSESLQVLDSAGSIVRENAAQTYFRVSPHTAGPYGESVFKSLSPADQEKVDKVAAIIKREFEAAHELGQSG